MIPGAISPISDRPLPAGRGIPVGQLIGARGKVGSVHAEDGTFTDALPLL